MTLFLCSFFSLMLLSMPISFSMLISSVIYLVAHDIPLMIAVQRVTVGIGDSFPLLAVPFFILAGSIMNSGGITDRIFSFANCVVGHITGGLGHANILASIIFSGMSGTAIADAGGLGAIELKAMKNAGYDEDFSLAITGASSIIGPIIPPSIPAVIFGVTAGVSIGRLFVGGVAPGLLMAFAMSVLVYYQSKKRHYPRRPRASAAEIWRSVKKSFFALITPLIILSSIIIGVITPTEAAIVAACYSLVLSICYRTFGISDVRRVLQETIMGISGVFFIVACASLFGWILASEQIPQKLSLLFLANISERWIALIVINIFLLIVGTFMDTTAAIIILVPVLMPVTRSFGIDPVHFGLIMILNLMIGLLTPPVGLVLYVLSGISKVPFEKITRAVTPYVLVLTLVLFLITFVPKICLFLPNLLFQ